MAEKNERTLKMKQEYVRLHFEEGKSPKEIAEIFNLNVTTVYAATYEIAKETGIPREELLDQPHEKPVSYIRKFEPVRPVDPQRAYDFCKTAMTALDQGLEEVRSVINELEREDR